MRNVYARTQTNVVRLPARLESFAVTRPQFLAILCLALLLAFGVETLSNEAASWLVSARPARLAALSPF